MQRGCGFPGEDDEQEDPVMQGLRDDVARGTRRRLVTRLANSEREHAYITRSAG